MEVPALSPSEPISQLSPQRVVIFEGASWLCIFDCKVDVINIQVTDFDTTFAQSTVPVNDILRQLISANVCNSAPRRRTFLQVKEGGRIMSWGALSPKFVNSVEQCKHFHLERISENELALDFTIHLAMSDDPPIRMQLDVLDALNARVSMLKMTWAFVACRSQARSTARASIDPGGAVRAAGTDASSDAFTKCSDGSRPKAKKPKKPEVFGVQPDSP